MKKKNVLWIVEVNGEIWHVFRKRDEARLMKAAIKNTQVRVVKFVEEKPPKPPKNFDYDFDPLRGWSTINLENL